MATGVVDLFVVYQFLRRLVTPFKSWPAYDAGVIDERGKILIPKNKRTTIEQKKAFKIFDLMILKLKRLLEKIPFGKSILGRYAAALWLIKEQENWQNKTEDELLNENIDEQFYSYMREAKNKKLKSLLVQLEDAPVNATGASVVGTGDNAVHWRKSRKKPVMSRRFKTSRLN